MRYCHLAYTPILAALTIVTLGCASPETAGPGPTDDDAPADYTTTHSGLKYRILRKSQGRRPASTDTVTVHYKGQLDNGRQFDSSYDRNKPSTFALNRVVPGWTEGLQLVGEGGMIELAVPPKLGYGPQGVRGRIPPGATLYFVVELEQVH